MVCVAPVAFTFRTAPSLFQFKIGTIIDVTEYNIDELGSEAT